MNKPGCRTVAGAVLVGTIGSLFGWYLDDMAFALSATVSKVNFGSALLWCILAAMFIILFNRLVYKD